MLGARSRVATLGLVVWASLVDTRTVFQKLPWLVVIAFLINVAIESIKVFFVEDDSGGKVFREGLDALRLFLMIPCEIAFYRLILLGEISSHYSFAIRTARFCRFLLWTAAMWLAALVALHGFTLIPETSGVCIKCISGVLLLVAYIFVFPRLVLVFPAIAVDAPDANAATAWALSKGHFWFVFRSLLIAHLPMIAGFFVAEMLAEVESSAAMPITLKIGGAFMNGALEAITVVAVVVVVARAYAWLGAPDPHPGS